MKSTIEARVTALVEPYIRDLNLELVDVEYVKEGAHWYLRIYIDKDGGVELDDCSVLSHMISAKLDQADPVGQTYMLEVSSPGLERTLKKKHDFARFTGRLITVHTSAAHQGYTEFTGYLVGLEDSQIILKYDEETIKIPWDLVKKAHLAVEF